ncbi:hypothetical protein [Chengkuizengella marina]|uniref:Uncharacterized protein n=1 Tax=Chengkuizengella marina TaxID=2507566 RepID=A0A6N9Q2M1_9BACL|nr:hypothetical protein [Chengkuizengella marina]NBI28658.1 hypothetical protein [Chengkuizengella marina]
MSNLLANLKTFIFEWEHGVDYVITENLEKSITIIEEFGMGKVDHYDSIKTIELDIFFVNEPMVKLLTKDIIENKEFKQIPSFFLSITSLPDFLDDPIRIETLYY